MADRDLPEIQPTGSGRGKQVVFLVMTGIVMAVVIFLLGVSVGRGIRTSPSADVGDAGDTTVAATPPVTTSAADLSYHDALQGGAPAPDAAKTAPPPAASAPAGPPPPIGDGKSAAAAPAATLPPAEPAASASKTPYSVQVGAFGTAKAAQSLVAMVKARDTSYPVSMLTMGPGEPSRYRAVVGPYATLAEAQRVADRLKKDGFAALIKH